AADGMATHRAAGRRERRLATSSAQLVVGIAVGEARTGLLARQLDLRLAGNREGREVALLGEDGAEIGTAGAGIHDFEAGRLRLWRGGGRGRRRGHGLGRWTNGLRRCRA